MWQIEPPTQYLYIIVNRWIATNMTGNQVIVSKIFKRVAGLSNIIFASYARTQALSTSPNVCLMNSMI